MTAAPADPARPLVRLWHGATVLTMDPARGDPLGTIADGAVGCDAAGLIAWVGDSAAAPPAAETIACDGALLTPGLIDCHTHLVWAGSRADEFERLLEGASYAQIAAAGGGIRSTVAATRAASAQALTAAALPRLDALMADGVTTVEIKSGYGLDRETERRLLQVARALPQHRPVRVVTTYLGAHAVPPDLDRRAYLDLVCALIADLAAERLADAVDGFCETIAFTCDEMRRVFKAAQAAGLPVKLHADQLTHSGGTALAARVGALSADHVEYATADDARALAAAGTVAVILPGAFYTLRETRVPPIAALRQHGVAMAVATDCNPGSSPMTSLLLAMNMAATLFRMTVTEVMLGVTRHAAQALGLGDSAGMIATGRPCDLALWEVARAAELVQPMGHRPLRQRVLGGQITHGADRAAQPPGRGAA